MTTNKGANRTFLVTILVYVGFSLVYGFLTRGMNISIYVDIFLSQAIVFLPAWIYIRKSGMKVRECIPYKKIKISDVLLLVVMTYLFYPLVLVLNMLTMFLVDNQVVEMTQSMQGERFFLNMLCFAILPACVEEFFFRGMLYQTYRKSSMKIGMFLSAFLFGCMHLNFNQFLYTFAFGIFLVLVIEGTGSIYASMICHFVLNLNMVIIMKIQSSKGIESAVEESAALLEDSQMMLMGTLSWLVIAIFTTACVFGLWVFMAKKNQRLEAFQLEFARPKTEKFITIPLIIGIVFAIGMIIWMGIAS